MREICFGKKSRLSATVTRQCNSSDIHSSHEAGNNAGWTVDDGLEMTRLEPMPVDAALNTGA